MLIRISFDPLLVFICVLVPSLTIVSMFSSSAESWLKSRMLDQRVEKGLDEGSDLGSKTTAEYERFSVSDPSGDS